MSHRVLVVVVAVVIVAAAACAGEVDALRAEAAALRADVAALRRQLSARDAAAPPWIVPLEELALRAGTGAIVRRADPALADAHRGAGPPADALLLTTTDGREILLLGDARCAARAGAGGVRSYTLSWHVRAIDPKTGGVLLDLVDSGAGVGASPAHACTQALANARRLFDARVGALLTAAPPTRSP